MKTEAKKQKRIFRISFFFTCAFLFLQFATNTFSQNTDDTGSKAKFQGTVELGAQVVGIQGGHTAKFEEVRDVPRGFFIQNLKLRYVSENSPYFFRLQGLEIRERDQRFTGEIGKVGKYRTQFVWDQIPHKFGTGQSFLVRTAPGVYSVDPTLRAQLQALTLADNVRTPPNGPLSTLVRQQLQTAPFTESRLRRDRALFKQSFYVSKSVEVYAQVSWLRNRGTRPMSAGTFVRRNVASPPLADIGGLWEGIGQEFLEPINQRTTDLKLGAQFHGERWRARIEYNLSVFRNRIESLIFENPFRVTDDQGCTIVAGNRVCGASNRFRQVRWQNDLAPNNDSHTFTFWASYDLTKDTQLRGFFSLATWTQNDPFLPWTLNTAIVPLFWDNQTTVTNPTDVNQLPAKSLNGKMRNMNNELALVNRGDTFRFHATYRSQFLNNKSPMIIFPGYAAFGDSTWRAARTDFYNIPIENLDWDFRQQKTEAGFEWEPFSNLTWRLDYKWEVWNRKFRDVNRNNEHSFRNRFDFDWVLSGKSKGKAAERANATTLRLKLDYLYAYRKPQVYNTQPLSFCTANNLPDCPTGANGAGAPASSPQTAWVVTPFTRMNDGFPIEFNLLRRYDETGRVRNDATFQLELLRGPNTSFSASYRYFGDEHSKNFYGRLFNRTSSINAEFSHTFENGSYLFANYSRDNNRFAYRDLAHLLIAPNIPGAIIQGTLAQFPIANTWERTSRNNLDSFEFGVNMAPVEGKLQNWQFDLSYAITNYRERISTLNPYAVRADSVLHAGANPYPDIAIRRQNVNLAVTRRITDKYEIGFRYWYEPYKQDDYSFNILSPYIHGNATSDLPKYMFQDARYASYHANVANIFLRYTF